MSLKSMSFSGMHSPGQLPSFVEMLVYLREIKVIQPDSYHDVHACSSIALGLKMLSPEHPASLILVLALYILIMTFDVNI